MKKWEQKFQKVYYYMEIQELVKHLLQKQLQEKQMYRLYL